MDNIFYILNLIVPNLTHDTFEVIIAYLILILLFIIILAGFLTLTWYIKKQFKLSKWAIAALVLLSILASLFGTFLLYGMYVLHGIRKDLTC